ncbi:enoyl-CoA hydratase/isomerase family protein, partial [Sinorhizobium fredii]
MTIVTTINGAVATIRIDRPEKLNALDVAHLRELRSALKQASDNNAVRVLVLTGTGRAFCVGADLTASRDNERSLAAAFGL